MATQTATPMLHTGKLAATRDDRDLLFHNYVDTTKIDLDSPPPQARPGHANKMPKPRLMLGNGPDNSVEHGFGGAGDCVFAMICNLFRLAWGISGKGTFPADGKTAIDAYSEVTGYVIGDESTDNGTNMRTALNWLRRTGIADEHGDRHKIGAYAAIDISNWNHIMWALYLADTGVPLGIQFPNTAMEQFDHDKPWTVVSNYTIEGGHAILLDRTLKVETWARDEGTAKAFLEKFVDEAYFVITPEGLLPGGKSIEGFSAQDLLADARRF